jgi:hypothetical protein
MLDNGCSTIRQSDILLEIEKSYAKLYSNYKNNLHDVELESIVSKENINILNFDMSNELEGIITRKEVLSALKNMKNTKSTGMMDLIQNFVSFLGEISGAFY